MHGKRSNAGTAKTATTTNVVTPLPPANGKHQVVAEDGKVHVHPNPKEEKNSVLVMACLADERKTNPNEGPSACTVEGQGNPPAFSVPSLGAALLDEEWWLMSAIASRTPEEVVANQSSKLLPTFYEAMGEKDANAPPHNGSFYRLCEHRAAEHGSEFEDAALEAGEELVGGEEREEPMGGACCA